MRSDTHINAVTVADAERDQDAESDSYTVGQPNSLCKLNWHPERDALAFASANVQCNGNPERDGNAVAESVAEPQPLADVLGDAERVVDAVVDADVVARLDAVSERDADPDADALPDALADRHIYSQRDVDA